GGIHETFCTTCCVFNGFPGLLHSLSIAVGGAPPGAGVPKWSMRRSSDVLSAIGRERRAGDKACRIRGQEGDATRHLFGFAEPADRNLADDLFRDVSGNGLDHFSGYIAGADCVYGDAEAGAFLCKRLGETKEPCLGG